MAIKCSPLPFGALRGGRKSKTQTWADAQDENDESEQPLVVSRARTEPPGDGADKSHLRAKVKCAGLPLAALRGGRITSQKSTASLQNIEDVQVELDTPQKSPQLQWQSEPAPAVPASWLSENADGERVPLDVEPLSPLQPPEGPRRASRLSTVSQHTTDSRRTSLQDSRVSTPRRSYQRSSGSIVRATMFLEHRYGSVERLRDIYEVEEWHLLGEGGFGTVRRARLRDVQTPCSKQIDGSTSIPSLLASRQASRGTLSNGEGSTGTLSVGPRRASKEKQQVLAGVQEGSELSVAKAKRSEKKAKEESNKANKGTDLWTDVENWWQDLIGCCTTRSEDALPLEHQQQLSARRQGMTSPKPSSRIDSPYSAHLPDKGSPHVPTLKQVASPSWQPRVRPWDRAVKTVPRRKLQDESVVRTEIAVLRSLDHPCICRLFETFEDKNNFYMVLENIEGRDLFEDISARKHMSEHRVACMTLQVFQALQYCHEMTVIHRDIKPENIMVMRTEQNGNEEDPQIKLIDFGLAVVNDMPTAGGCRFVGSSNVMGTNNFLAPEARRGEATRAADMWGVGVVLYILLSGMMPKQCVLDGEEMLNFRSECESWTHVSDAAKDLLTNLIHINPNRRLSAASAALHPWILECKEDRLPQMNLPGMVDAFVSYHMGSALKRAVLTAVATQMAGRHIGELRQQFLAWDRDGNGRISKEEMEAMMPGRTFNDALKAELVDDWDRVFDSIDTDGSGEIEYTEWLAACQHQLALRSDQAIRSAFRVFDVNNDGGISKAELARVVIDDSGVLMDDFAGNFAQCDLNGDGVIDYYEFKSMLLSGKV